MVELELFLDESFWNQSWLLNEIQIDSSTETFSGTITAETFSWVDPKTIRATFTVEAALTKPATPIPAVITSHSSDHPALKTLTPSAGTSWPIPEHTEILYSQNIAMGTLYNHAMQDPVCEKNYSQHILRANENTEFIIDDAESLIKFNYAGNYLQLDKNISLVNPLGNICINPQNINYNSQYNSVETIGENSTFQVKENYSNVTQTGNMTLKISQWFNNNAEQNIFLNSGKVLQFKTNTLSLTSDDSVNINSSEKMTVESQETLDIHSDQDITIIGENAITLHQNGNTIEITSEKITVTANQVTVSGQLILSVMPI